MSPDPEIMCFQHCCRDSRVFCLEVPEACPVCGSDLLHGEPVDFITPSFIIPCPFVSVGVDNGCCILIRPTMGDFLHTYKSSSDLHIGITDSQGNIYDYDREGVHKRSIEDVNEEPKTSLWNQSLVIPILKKWRKQSKKSDEWMQHWDYVLSITAGMDNWTSQEYSESGNNCYSFVLFFLKMLKLPDLKQSLSSKTKFCQDFILPRSSMAAKYIALYRRVIREGISVLQIKNRSPSPFNSPDKHEDIVKGSHDDDTYDDVGSDSYESSKPCSHESSKPCSYESSKPSSYESTSQNYMEKNLSMENSIESDFDENAIDSKETDDHIQCNNNLMQEVVIPL